MKRPGEILKDSFYKIEIKFGEVKCEVLIRNLANGTDMQASILTHPSAWCRNIGSPEILDGRYEQERIKKAIVDYIKTALDSL